jgi:hypothetical protein
MTWGVAGLSYCTDSRAKRGRAVRNGFAWACLWFDFNGSPRVVELFGFAFSVLLFDVVVKFFIKKKPGIG